MPSLTWPLTKWSTAVFIPETHPVASNPGFRFRNHNPSPTLTLPSVNNIQEPKHKIKHNGEHFVYISVVCIFEVPYSSLRVGIHDSGCAEPFVEEGIIFGLEQSNYLGNIPE